MSGVAEELQARDEVAGFDQGEWTERVSSPENLKKPFDTPCSPTTLPATFSEKEPGCIVSTWDCCASALLSEEKDSFTGFRSAHLAQLVEHVLGKDEVSGSSPEMSSMM